jgi:hypothetical protein
MLRRKTILVGLILVAGTHTACSFITDLVVANLSDKPIEVKYRVKEYPGPFSPPARPATKATNQLTDDSPWTELSADQYQLDPASRTVTVTVMAKSALLIQRVSGPGVPNDAASFAINEVLIVGAYGEMMFQGEQVQKCFMPESKKVYAIRYK